MVQTEFEKGLQLGLVGYIPSGPYEFIVDGKKQSAKLNQLVVFCYDSIEHETEKAYLIVRNDLKYWMPKSKIFNNSFEEDFKEFQNVNYFITDTLLFDKLTPLDLPGPRNFSHQVIPEDFFSDSDMPNGFEDDYYNDQLDMDQQSPEFWDNL